MAATTVLVTGVTGYIGGSVLTYLLGSNGTQIKPVKISALLRNEEKARLLADKGVDTVVFEERDATNHLQKIGANFDVIIDPAFTFQPSYCEALIAGQGDRKKLSGKEVYYIHQSGTSNIANQPISKAFTETRTYSDKEDILAYQRFRESVDAFGQRTSDLAVLDAGLREGVKTSSIMSPTIFGRGTGQFNQSTVQTPLLVRAAIKLGHAVVVGDGSSVWNCVSIHDLCSLYSLLLSRILSGQDIATGEMGVIFSENGTFNWLELAQTIAETGTQLGLLQTNEITHLDPEKAAEVLFPFPTFCELGLGSTALTKADCAREYGWNPVHSKSDMMESVKLEFEAAIAASKQ
ncbi:hypothetical protein CLAIMM_03882 [Cladophialophora immunda]|nr:hypothetical protein CLAIMM_03882 [Cladophialophora immunda]